jgi:mediator of RNA polymerase II transcription subunit 18
MQPVQSQEIHLVFKARAPSGLDKIASSGGSQGVLPPETQRYRNMLNASLYYVQLVGEVQPDSTHVSGGLVNGGVNVAMANETSSTPKKRDIKWYFEFQDTPDPGKQPVSTRMVSRTPLEAGDIVTFLDHFGYEYVSRYMVVGHKFYELNTTIHVHKLLTLPQASIENAITNLSFLDKVSDLQELDGSGGHMVQTSIDVIDGNNPELKDKATRQLLGIREALRQAIDLTPGDRLSLDTRLPAVNRRV